MKVKKAFKDLNLKNSFLFAATMADPETCRLVLEILLGIPISKVNVHTEHTILFSSDLKSVRLDVYASDELEVMYDLEMQDENEGNLPKRSRSYQGQMDVSFLPPGGDYNKLPPSYVIFICTFDPFGKDLYKYTFEEMCKEIPFVLGSETKKIFLNTKGENAADVPEELVHFLRYVENTTDNYVAEVNDGAVSRIHGRVKDVKANSEMEARYMTVEELIERRGRQEREEGLQQGLQQGEDGMVELISYMLRDGLSDQISNLTTDKNFLNSMYEKYNLR